MAVSPRNCAEQKVQTGSGWRPPRSGDQGDDGRPWLPEEEQATQCDELSG